VVDAVADRWCRHHEVSILIAGGTGVGRCFGCCPRKKVSMMIMRPPQQGQGCSGCFGSSPERADVVAVERLSEF
jgi:hypothetical protein